MDNLTGENTTVRLDNVAPLKSFIIDCVAIIVSFTTALVATCALVTLCKCRKLPFQMKKLSYNVIIPDILFHLMILSIAVGAVCFGETVRSVVFYPRTVGGAMLLVISLASVAGLTLDRLLAMTKPLMYHAIVTEKLINRLTLFIWLSHPVAMFTTLLISAYNFCNWQILQECDPWYLLLPFRIVLAVFCVVYHSFIVFSYIKISKTLTTDQNIQRQTLTRNIIRIVLTFELTNLPIFVHSLSFTFMPFLQVKTFEIPFLMLSYVCGCLNAYISLYFYVWRMKECRYVFLSTFMFWNKKCNTLAANLKQDMYGISSPNARTGI